MSVQTQGGKTMDPIVERKLKNEGWHSPGECPSNGCDKCLEDLASSTHKTELLPEEVISKIEDYLVEIDPDKTYTVSVTVSPKGFVPSFETPYPPMGSINFINGTAGDIIGVLAFWFTKYPDILEKVNMNAQYFVYGKGPALAYQRAEQNFNSPLMQEHVKPRWEKEGLLDIYEALSFIHAQCEWAIGKPINEILELRAKWEEKQKKKGQETCEVQ